MSFFQISSPLAARRLFLGHSGLALSAVAVALLARNDALAATNGRGDAQDVQILNTALAAELEAIAAYQLGAESKLLQGGVLDVALRFQRPPQGACRPAGPDGGEAGRQPVQAKPRYSFPVEQPKSQADVLKFAASLERGAVSAYLGAVPLFDSRYLSKAAVSILCDEAMHWAVLRQALGETPVPGAFVS